MATNVKVIGPGFHQTTIKVTPATHLTDVLEQACTKFKVDSSRYLLKHKQKQIDLSHTWRTAGLAPGASLELIVRSNSPTVLNVGLQLPPSDRNLFPPNGRLTEKLPNDFTLWKVLRQFESGKASKGKNLNITARGVAKTEGAGNTGSGQLFYETPVLRLGNDARQFSTFADFQKTLAQFGYNSSSVLIHLSYKPTDITFADAIASIDEFFKEQREEPREEPEAHKSEEPAVVASNEATKESEGESLKEPPTPDPSQVPPPESMEIDEPLPSDSNRSITVFSAPSSATPAAALRNDSEDAFQPGFDHAQAHQRLLKTQGENKRLLSDRELEEKATTAREGLAKTRSITIKVRLPDNTSIQASFGQDDTGATLYNVVRSQMEKPDLAFKLVIPPGRDTRDMIRDSDSSGKRDDNKLILGYGLRGATMVNFVWADSVDTKVRKEPVLKSSVAAQAQQIQVPKTPEPVAQKEDSMIASAAASSSQSQSSGAGGAAFKKPKWLKGFGKK